MPAEEYDKITTRYDMYVPQKYLPMLLETCLMSKESLRKLVIESTSQGEKSDSLKPQAILTIIISCFRLCAISSAP